MVLGVVGWDRKEFPESNLPVCGRDDTMIVVYNIGRYTKKGDWEKSKLENKTMNSCIILIVQQDNII